MPRRIVPVELSPESRDNIILVMMLTISFSLAIIGLWVYDLRQFAKNEVLATQNRVVEEQLFSDIKDAESGQRGYLLTNGDETYLPQYLVAVNKVHADVRLLRAYLKDRSDEQPTLRVLSGLVDSKLNELESTLATFHKGGIAPALAIVRTNKGYYTMAALRDQIDILRGQERDFVRKKSAGIY